MQGKLALGKIADESTLIEECSNDCLLASVGLRPGGVLWVCESFARRRYETSDRASRVAAEVETVSVGAIARLLGASAEQAPLGIPYDVSNP